MLTKKQKELLIDLIDGYFYPRDLIKDYEKFLEIRKVLDPYEGFDIEDEDTYPPHFQHGYWEHDNFDKLNTDKEEVSK